LVNEVGIIDIGGLTAIDEDSCFHNVDVPKGSSTPMDQVSQPYFGPRVGVKPNTPKVANLESSGTPECSELDSKAQKISN
jgi:hypothetical protein